jgi:Flp pilus assembly protein TadG
MMNRLGVIRGKLREAKGQAIVEFALIIIPLLVFITFIADMGLIGFQHVSVTNAVREGARCAAVGGAPAAVQTRVADAIGGDVENLAVPAPTYTGGEVGDSVTVSASYEYPWLTPIDWVPGLPGTLEITKSATMRMEAASPYTKSC